VNDVVRPAAANGLASVDVVVPCYDYARFLERCVDSLLTQEGVEVRVLVIDDASSDDTPDVGRRLAARDSRVEFRRHDTNQGHIATYNEGLLGWAAADYSLLLSADDVLAPGALRRATELMERNPRIGMTYGRAIVIHNDDEPPSDFEPGPDERRVVPGEHFLRYCFENAYNPVPTPTAIVRTAAQRAVGGYSRELPHSGDLEMWMRFAVRGPIGALRTVQAFYRWHARNMGVQYYNQQLGDRREFLLTCDRVLERCRERFPDAMGWRDAVYRSVGNAALRSANKSLELGNLRECEAWLEFAERTDPRLRGSPLWWRFQLKRRLSLKVWQWARAILHRLQGVPARTIESSHFVGLDRGQQVGWWPG
jgi:glycosyltransferase involved in cell wall biosynthesis